MFRLWCNSSLDDLPRLARRYGRRLLVAALRREDDSDSVRRREIQVELTQPGREPLE